MAIICECNSVFIPYQAIIEDFDGGEEAFIETVPNLTLLSDDEIVRVSFMVPNDARKYVELLETMGLNYKDLNERNTIATVDQEVGLVGEPPSYEPRPCDWIEVGQVEIDFEGEVVIILAARLKGSKSSDIITPDYWRPSQMLRGSDMPNIIDKRFSFLREEGNIEVWWDNQEKKEVYTTEGGIDGFMTQKNEN